VVFQIDDEKIFLSSNRWAVRRPVPGRVWAGEHLVFHMPFDTLVRLANAKKAAIKLDRTLLELNEVHRQSLKAFVDKVNSL
jgi:hypothetical protein